MSEIPFSSYVYIFLAILTAMIVANLPQYYSFILMFLSERKIKAFLAAKKHEEKMKKMQTKMAADLGNLMDKQIGERMNSRDMGEPPPETGLPVDPEFAQMFPGPGPDDADFAASELAQRHGDKKNMEVILKKEESPGNMVKTKTFSSIPTASMIREAAEDQPFQLVVVQNNLPVETSPILGARQTLREIFTEPEGYRRQTKKVAGIDVPILSTTTIPFWCETCRFTSHGLVDDPPHCPSCSAIMLPIKEGELIKGDEPLRTRCPNCELEAEHIPQKIGQPCMKCGSMVVCMDFEERWCPDPKCGGSFPIYNKENDRTHCHCGKELVLTKPILIEMKPVTWKCQGCGKGKLAEKLPEVCPHCRSKKIVEV